MDVLKDVKEFGVELSSMVDVFEKTKGYIIDSAKFDKEYGFRFIVDLNGVGKRIPIDEKDPWEVKDDFLGLTEYSFKMILMAMNNGINPSPWFFGMMTNVFFHYSSIDTDDKTKNFITSLWESGKLLNETEDKLNANISKD